MYTIDEIKQLQLNEEFYISEGDRFCLVSPQGKELNGQIMDNQAKFCVLQTLSAYKDGKIDKNQANYIIDKIDTIIYAVDMLGIEKVIDKLNKEVIEEELRIPFFNSICIDCDDLYASFE